MGKKDQSPVGHWFLLAEDAEEVDANFYSPRKLAPSGSGHTHLIWMLVAGSDRDPNPFGVVTARRRTVYVQPILQQHRPSLDLVTTTVYD
jgi:hypothetical protein